MKGSIYYRGFEIFATTSVIGPFKFVDQSFRYSKSGYASTITEAKIKIDRILDEIEDIKMVEKPDDTDHKLHMSPEGYEEKIVYDRRFFITQVANGKYRVYQNDEPIGGLYDTVEKANRFTGTGMMVMGGLLVDPQKTIDHMIDTLKK